jgi:hypothetical protein
MPIPSPALPCLVATHEHRTLGVWVIEELGQLKAHSKRGKSLEGAALEESLVFPRARLSLQEPTPTVVGNTGMLSQVSLKNNWDKRTDSNKKEKRYIHICGNTLSSILTKGD